MNDVNCGIGFLYIPGDMKKTREKKAGSNRDAADSSKHGDYWFKSLKKGTEI